jgi:dTDP-4-dehydrorhamnose reductase
MRILVLGVSGMLGNTIYRSLSRNSSLDVHGTLRSPTVKDYFSPSLQKKIHGHIDVLDNDILLDLMERVRPNVVINCVGLIKQQVNANNPLVVLPINSLLPHRLAKLCNLISSRLIHISTDCVFSGSKGSYTEDDKSDADDLYGKSKYIGEVVDQEHAITLRTSIIGHEINSNYALVDWFLSQKNAVQGYREAIFSGLPTVELSDIIESYVLPATGLHGLFHVSAEAINKDALIRLIAKVYNKEIEITPDSRVKIDRSLDSSRFRQITGYRPDSWPNLIKKMHSHRE